MRWFFQIFEGKKKLDFFKKHFSNRIEKLHKMAFIYFFLKKFEKIEKIGYHSNFNFECSTERGFKESLSIALGCNPLKTINVYLVRFLPCNRSNTYKYPHFEIHGYVINSWIKTTYYGSYQDTIKCSYSIPH